MMGSLKVTPHSHSCQSNCKLVAELRARIAERDRKIEWLYELVERATETIQFLREKKESLEKRTLRPRGTSEGEKE